MKTGTKTARGDVRRDLVMGAIDAYWLANYASPSLRQIADACGGMAISHVRLVLRQLAADGWLCPMEPGGRAYVPVWVKNRIEGVENV